MDLDIKYTHQRTNGLVMKYNDLENGKYRNPILFADYSDPDVIRVGDTFYMTASSFNYTPGLPILVSKDLVNWKLVNYALENIGQERYRIPRHSEGVWAPAIRYHEGMFYIYYGMPDEGFYVVRSKDPLGKWEEPVCILEGKGLIDSCPFWDEDGRAYVIHGYAKSRIGFKSILGIFEMSPDGLKAISEDHFIFDGNDPAHPALTIEGPKVYKRNGFYYIWAPAGGVRQGYQVVLRSRDIRGPYEIKTVMEQGDTIINGPHQGGLVDTINGDEWFIHFQDRGLYGRICHLQPVSWRGDWPVVGSPKNAKADHEKTDLIDDNISVGEPVYEWNMPNCEVLNDSDLNSYFPDFGECEIYELPDNIFCKNELSDFQEHEAKGNFGHEAAGVRASDRFINGEIGLCWQWMGDHDESFAGQVRDSEGNIQDGLRLFCQNPSGDEQPTIWRSANVLTQKLVYPVFEAKAELDATGLKDGDRAGVVMTGGQYVTAFIERRDDDYFICVANSQGPDDKKDENRISSFSIATIDSIRDMNQIVGELYFRLRFTYENRSFDSQQLYFQDVNSPMFGENPCLTIELGIKDANGNIQYKDLGVNFTPSDHTWVGAKLGIYALGSGRPNTGFSEAGKDCSDHSNAQCGYVDLRSIEVREL
jgi:hypothetical protein